MILILILHCNFVAVVIFHSCHCHCAIVVIRQCFVVGFSELETVYVVACSHGDDVSSLLEVRGW